MKSFAKSVDLPRTDKIKDPEIKAVFDKILEVIDTMNRLLYGNIGAALIDITGTGTYYLGDPNTDGSWRITVDGNDLHSDRRESGVWVTKGGFLA